MFIRCGPSDSLQLAAALTWCQHQPAQRRFISGDPRICDAAEAAGFVVIAFGTFWNIDVLSRGKLPQGPFKSGHLFPQR